MKDGKGNLNCQGSSVSFSRCLYLQIRETYQWVNFGSKPMPSMFQIRDMKLQTAKTKICP